MRRSRPWIPAFLTILLLPACVAAPDDPGSWQPPTALIPENPSYPSCAESPQCRWGERCDTEASTCTADGGPWEHAPDFTLPDRNANSASFGKDVALSGQQGLVTVLYFGLSTCSVCWGQVANLQNLLEQLALAGTGQVMALVIDHAQGDGHVEDGIGRFTTFPVLQDPPGRTVWGLYGAVKDSVVVIDPNGFVRARWTVLDIGASAALLETAIRDAADPSPKP